MKALKARAARVMLAGQVALDIEPVKDSIPLRIHFGAVMI
jgi:hypothetical protein